MYKIDHLSVSQVNTFSRCELQWFFRYVEGLKIVPNSALIRGKAVHEGLSEIYTCMKVQEQYIPERIIDLVVDYVTHADDNEEVNWDKPKDTIKDVSVKLVNTYIQEKYPESISPSEIENVEEKIEHNLFTDEGDEVPIVGYPDLILGSRIIDFKTSSRKPREIDTQYKFQTAFYTTVTNKKVIELQYLITKKEPEIITLFTKADKTIKAISRMVFMNTFKKVRSSIRSGNFLPTGIFHPWACKYCAYGEQGHCSYYLTNTH